MLVLAAKALYVFCLFPYRLFKFGGSYFLMDDNPGESGASNKPLRRLVCGEINWKDLYRSRAI